MKKAWYMAKKLLWDLSNKGKYVPTGPDFESPKLGTYYLQFGEDLSKLNALISSFDDEGVPLNKSYVDVENAGLHYYPISIGQVALAIFHTWQKTHSTQKREHFLRIANWFVHNAERDQELGAFWMTDVPKPEYQVYEPWKSAFSQSRAISVLLRAWQLTDEKEFLNVATEALKPFAKDIDDGGVAVRRKNTPVIYEEYVASVPTRVLDGHCFSLFGIYDYVRATKSLAQQNGHLLALRLFQDGIKGLAQSLPDYDLGYWARFNQCELPDYPTDDPCTITYLQLVITQLDILYRISKNATLLAYKDGFSSYITWKNIVKMYRHKFSALKNLNRL